MRGGSKPKRGKKNVQRIFGLPLHLPSPCGATRQSHVITQ